MQDKYGIKFYKKVDPHLYTGYYFDAKARQVEYGDMATHLGYSDEIATLSQIEELDDASQGRKVQEFWGEVMGSSLEIFQNQGNVQIAYMDIRIPIQDFKLLLEEWLYYMKS